ncbi:hypothetical protein [Pseudoalteromonas byunsanensis]|uniref:Uncharacterized protein n=1 Tax=Pseudoalteromonas byunsanensis TaxID=327939 RepID=A0A1S1NEB4_9GAMM|nr:hypothetical protein [Pseudoalteromonas byunsanensis]OHU97141.1 hypothetical protein BIW53_02140 [Pseudoalteromonas byunsanensis]
MIVINNIQLDNAVWTDEYDYQGVAEQTERALNGAQHIEKTAIVGRPITIESALEAAALYIALFEHSQTELAAFDITIRGTTFNVVWDHSQKPVTGSPLQYFSDSEPTHFENITLRLKTV